MLAATFIKDNLLATSGIFPLVATGGNRCTIAVHFERATGSSGSNANWHDSPLQTSNPRLMPCKARILASTFVQHNLGIPR